MIKHIWSVLCRSSAIDKDGNNLSLFDVFEQLTILEPITQPGEAPIPFQLVTLWARADLATPVKTTSRVRVLLPGGDEASKPVQLEVDLTAFRRLRQRVTFGSLPIRAAGVYEFIVEFREHDEWREAARIPLELTVEPQQGISPSAIQ